MSKSAYNEIFDKYEKDTTHYTTDYRTIDFDGLLKSDTPQTHNVTQEIAPPKTIDYGILFKGKIVGSHQQYDPVEEQPTNPNMEEIDEQAEEEEGVEQQEGSEDVIENSNLNEAEEMIDDEEFIPTGQALRSSVIGGKIALQFENGEFKNYNGEPNTIVPYIYGYWIGDVPNASQPPLNQLDSYFMAFHIEREMLMEDAYQRLKQRIEAGFKNRTIAANVDSEEVRVANVTLGCLEKTGNINALVFNLENSTSGLLATMKNYYIENFTPSLKGDLPGNIFVPDNVEIPTNKSIENAVILCEQLGDLYTADKMKRILGEYIKYQALAAEYIDRAAEMHGQKTESSLERIRMEAELDSQRVELEMVKELFAVLNKPIADLFNIIP